MMREEGLGEGAGTTRPDGRVARDSVLVGVGLTVLSALSAIQAVAIVFIVGKGPDTDAFFIAYSLYVPVALIGVSLRRTLVPVLGSPTDSQAFRRQASETVGRISIIAILCGMVLAGLAVFAAQLLMPHASPAVQGTLTTSLLLLAVSAAAQIYAGSIAAVLSALQLFPVSIAIYVGASFLGVVTSCGLILAIGILGAPVGLCSAAVALVVAHLMYCGRLGVSWKWDWRWTLQRRQAQLFGYILAGVALALATQFGLVFALSAVTLAGGSATLYSYAFFITGVMLNLSSVPLSITILPRVVADVARVGQQAVVNNFILVVPYVLVVLLPMLSAFAAFGRPILDAVFGSALSTSSINEIYLLSVCLALMAVATAIFGVGGSMLLAERHWWSVATVAVATIAIEAAVIYASRPRGVYAIAIAHGLGASLGMVVLTGTLFGRQTFRIVGKLVRESWRAPALCAIFAIPPVVIGDVRSVPVDLLLLVFTMTAYCLLAAAFWPEVSQRFADLLSIKVAARLRARARA